MPIFGLLCLAVAAENVYKFMLNALLDKFAGRSEVLTRIEVCGILDEVLSDSRGKGKTKVGVDIDLADSHRSSFTKHIFGNALSPGHCAAVLIDHLDVFGNNAGRAVKNDGKFGKAFADFFENIETKFCFALEFIRAVRSSDCDCKRVYAGFGYEFLNLIGIGVAGIGFGNVYRVFDSCKSAELGFDNDAVIVSVIDNRFGDLNVLVEV